MKYNRSEYIKAGVREGFQNGTSKYANRRCYGYDVTADGSLVINPDEAKIVRWMFQRYLHGDSLHSLFACLGKTKVHDLSWSCTFDLSSLMFRFFPFVSHRKQFSFPRSRMVVYENHPAHYV